MKILFFLALFPVFLCAEIRILILGDSNSYGVPREHSWVNLLKEHYGESPKIKFINYAVGLANADQCDMIYEIAAEHHKPHIVIYAGGLVDVIFKSGLDRLEFAMSHTIERCVSNGSVVLFGLINFSCWHSVHNFDPTYLEEANKIYYRVANKFNVFPFTFLDEDILCNPKFNLGDWVHPNYDGQRIISFRVKSVLDNVLLIMMNKRNDEIIQ